MHNQSYVFAQLASHLDRNKFNYLVRKYQGDKSRAFVFLKAGQTKEQKISLRGMKEAGILLFIRLSSKSAPNAVYVRTPNGSKYGEYRSLPDKVKGYLLYTGSFNSNDLTIYFSNNSLG